MGLLSQKGENMINKFIGVGNLGKDPEVNYLQSGTCVCNFSIACTEKYKDKSGERVEKTEWVNCVVFGKLAEICGEYLHKGSMVYVEGRMQTDSYEAKDGSGKRYSTKINVKDMKMLGGKNREAAQPREAYAAQDNRPMPDDDDQIPF